MSDSLFDSQFDIPSRLDWENKIKADLKIDSLKSLVSNTNENISINPIYSVEDRSHSSSDIHNIIQNSKVDSNQWESGIYIQCDKIKDLSALVNYTKDFHSSTFFLSCGYSYNQWLNPFKGSTDINIFKELMHSHFILDYIDLNSILLSHIESLKTHRFTMINDSLYSYFLSKDDEKYNYVNTRFSKALELPHINLGISSYNFAKYGISAIEEVAIILGQIVDFIEFNKSNHDISSIFKKIEVLISVNSKYFMEIAKIRAIRYLWHYLLKSYHLSDIPCQIITVPSSWDKSVYDSETNILRNTTAAMSSILGGANTVISTPHDLRKTAKSSSYRTALNIQNLLKHESYLNQVIDPTYGSYYIESLTDQIIEKSLNLFLEIENKGGLQESISNGFLLSIIRAKNEFQIKDAQSIKAKNLGTNLHSTSEQYEVQTSDMHLIKDLNTFEKMTDLEALSNIYNFKLVKDVLPSPLMVDFEQIKTLKSNLTVAIVEFGSKAFSKARRTFVISILNLISHPYEDISFTDISNYDIVFFCSSDEDYFDLLKNTGLKTSTSQTRVLAGNLDLSKFSQIHCNYTVHLKTNRIDFIQDVFGVSHG